MHTNSTQTLSKVIVFTLDNISLWSGRRRLKREDLKLMSDDELPPEALASLGSKKIIDPEDINDFTALKKEAHRTCARIGVRFLGGYAVPEDKAPDLGVALDEIGARFLAKKAHLLANYDDRLADWVKSHPEWAGMLSEAALERSDVDRKLNYGWSSFKVVAADDDDASTTGLNNGLNTEVKGLAGQLYREVAQAATQVMETSLVGRDKVTQKILSPIRTIRGKLEGLSFLDNRVNPLIDTIDNVLSLLPKAGHIDGLGLSAIHGLVFILSSEERMTQHGQMVIDGADIDDAIKFSVPSLAKEMEAQAQANEQAQQQNVSTGPVTLPHVQAPASDFSLDALLGSPAAKPASTGSRQSQFDGLSVTQTVVAPRTIDFP